jgi:hypothetical protein
LPQSFPTSKYLKLKEIGLSMFPYIKVTKRSICLVLHVLKVFIYIVVIVTVNRNLELTFDIEECNRVFL